MDDLTREMRHTIGLVAQELEDEGDRVYLGSTNHADLLRDLDRRIFEGGFSKDVQAQVADMRAKRSAEAAATIERLTAALAASQAREAEMREALAEAEEVFALVEHPNLPDPLYHEEVKRLGCRIGFGALMSTASAGWREANEADGYPGSGAFVAGPCIGTVQATLKRIRAALATTEAERGALRQTVAGLYVERDTARAERDAAVERAERALGGDA